MDSVNIRVCSHCGMRYDWRRSASGSLKMTYCGSLCERAGLGFTIEALLTELLLPAVAPVPGDVSSPSALAPAA